MNIIFDKQELQPNIEKNHEEIDNVYEGKENGTENDSEPTNEELNAKETIMEIEGIVQGEADNNVVQSAGQITIMDDDRTKVNLKFI